MIRQSFQMDGIENGGSFVSGMITKEATDQKIHVEEYSQMLTPSQHEVQQYRDFSTKHDLNFIQAEKVSELINALINGTEWIETSTQVDL